MGAMIKDSQQYETTQHWVKKFTEAEIKMLEDEERKLCDPEGWLLIKDSYIVLRQKLLDEIAEYEALIAHDPSQPMSLFINDMDELSNLLIKARIAFKISQKELAGLCGLTEEKIKLYEDKDYQHASHLDFLAVSDALGFKIIEGKFVAKMHEFYLKRLENMRQTNVNAMQAAS
jgi:hypothetical protein